MAGNVKERLISFIEYKGLSKNKFEQICGFSKRYVSNISVSLQPDKIERISLNFPDLNIGWLLTGEGEMIIPSTSVEPQQTFQLRTDRTIPVQEIPLYDFDAAAGLVAIFNEMHADPVDYLRIPNLPAVDGAIFVRGDSMSPLLKSGDIVMYKKKELSINSILWGEIYLLSFQTDGDSYTAVKYIRKSETPGMVCLASFNPSFAPKDIPMSAITALALVKASLTFHTME